MKDDKEKEELEKKKEEEKKQDEEDINQLLSDIVNGDKTEESLEEFISGLDKKIKKKNNNNTIAYIFGLLVHKNIFIHFLITLVLNYLLMFAMQGFFKLVVYDKFYMFALSILIFSVAEFIIKAVFIKFFLKIVLTTFGLIFIALQLLYIELMYYFLPGYSFDNQTNLVIFILLFALFRYIITRVSHRYFARFKRGENDGAI